MSASLAAKFLLRRLSQSFMASSGISSCRKAYSFFSRGKSPSVPEGKALAAAFANAYNNLVRAMRDYKPQQVEGGLGKGGKLKVGD